MKSLKRLTKQTRFQHFKSFPPKRMESISEVKFHARQVLAYNSCRLCEGAGQCQSPRSYDAFIRFIKACDATLGFHPHLWKTGRGRKGWSDSPYSEKAAMTNHQAEPEG